MDCCTYRMQTGLNIDLSVTGSFSQLMFTLAFSQGFARNNDTVKKLKIIIIIKKFAQHLVLKLKRVDNRLTTKITNFILFFTVSLLPANYVRIFRILLVISPRYYTSFK